MPLVLVHNEVVSDDAYKWDDVEGVQYHYPAKYKGKVFSGEPFVYYRGMHRADGSRGPAEYIGTGRIGTTWVDPARSSGKKKAFYCSIEGYRRFAMPVPAKVEGVNLEDIPRNLWRDGVRALDSSVYAKILSAADAQPPASVVAPEPNNVAPVKSENLIVPSSSKASTLGGRSGYRRSKMAKAVGDWAEQVVVEYLRKRIPGISALVHRAAAGETPGWDIDYRDESDILHRVEVKGTVAGGFAGIELTAGEMRAANNHGPNYWLYLVAGCLSDAPRVQAVQNPAKYIGAGEWSATPSIYSLRF